MRAETGSDLVILLVVFATYFSYLRGIAEYSDAMLLMLIALVVATINVPYRLRGGYDE